LTSDRKRPKDVLQNSKDSKIIIRLPDINTHTSINRLDMIFQSCVSRFEIWKKKIVLLCMKWLRFNNSCNLSPGLMCDHLKWLSINKMIWWSVYSDLVMHLFLFWLSNVQSFTCVPVCIEELAYRFPTLRVFLFFFFVLKNIPLVHCLSVYFRLIKFGTSEVYVSCKTEAEDWTCVSQWIIIILKICYWIGWLWLYSQWFPVRPVNYSSHPWPGK